MKRVIPVTVVVLLIIAGIIFRSQLVAFGRNAYAAITPQLSAIRDKLSSTRTTEHAPRTTLTASGTIEAPTVDVASTTAGRIAALHVSEGQQVAAGDLIAEMDAAVLDTQIAQAQAAQAVAEAQVALLKAGARDADLAVARAAVVQAEAARDAARTASQDAQASVTAPGDLDVKIAGAASALQAAEQQVIAAQAGATAADLEQAMWGRVVQALEGGFDVPLPIPGGGTTHVAAPPDKLSNARLEWNLASQSTWEAHARVNTAIAARDAARQSLADLRSQRADPQTLAAQADAAASAFTIAEAAVQTAQANVGVLEAGAPAEQITAAQALVDQAAAAAQALLDRKAQTRIVAPRAGTVTSVVRRAGEVTAAGAPIVQLADLSKVTLTVYVPETQLGLVHLDAVAQVSVDSFPGRTFAGTVTFIGDTAEFTPKNVQTPDERAKLVFPVKLSLANHNAALKPGMPADARFGDAAMQQNGATVTIAASPGPGVSASQYSGTIEANETAVAAELSGRVIAVKVAEGDQVTAGQELVELDGQELAATQAQAQAAVAAAQADLARVIAAPQAARVVQAEAQVKQAEAALAAARTGLENARKLRQNPQDLDAQISSARGQVKTATAAVDGARAAVKAAQVLQESLPNPGSDEDKTRRAMYDQQVAAAQASLAAAQAQESGARAVLAQLLAIRAQPVSLDAAVHRAEGDVAKAEAALGVARATLAQVQAPAQPEAVAVAQAKVAQAEAALAQINVSMEKLKIASPSAGTVTVQGIHSGEVAQPGASLFTVADLSRLKLVVYVPTNQIGWVQLGMSTEVTVDAYPGRTFAGKVVHIADQAEFTPKNVQTQEERVSTVFAVEISLDNAGGLLKPGMPADAVFD